ncbi:outer membrane protein [Helicobacter ailurogastricus]|uniref:Outer membrane protein n=1 Tax=Helicobacter ailurogastricus TaxID=1578720 RepID=A0A0K2Y0N5_9HELI|nr:outer membrane protein [Helicobacter ailurogastricus]BDQ28329.1 hypothetical protein ASB7_01660 [Helicobacter ailurogastricus]CRF52861.1 hypothetical protein HAL07_13260 [Helicobacter ailurogastricus]
MFFHRLAVSLGLVCGLAHVALAEKNGIYVSGGLQYTLVKTTISRGMYANEAQPSGLSGYTPGMSNMYGFSLNAGYKMFFGNLERRNGVRAYVFYEYGYDNPSFNGPRLNDNVYGVGADYLFNFIDQRKMQVGFFMGLAFAGSSWSNSGASYVKSLAKYPGVSENFSYFQIPVNVGVRANVTRHQGFEFGLKIPLVRNYYFRSVAPGGIYGLTFQRSIVFYANYVYNF